MRFIDNSPGTYVFDHRVSLKRRCGRYGMIANVNVIGERWRQPVDPARYCRVVSSRMQHLPTSVPVTRRTRLLHIYAYH